jgi:hypothetical protein
LIVGGVVGWLGSIVMNMAVAGAAILIAILKLLGIFK